jgi:hypothetical protein
MTTTDLAPFLAIATDSFLSGWGGAAGRSSVIVYECRDEHEAKLACEYLEGRGEMKRVRTAYEGRKAYAPRNVHVSRYDAGCVRSVAWYRENQALMVASRAKDAAQAAARVGGAQ